MYQAGADKREFFRINDTVVINYKVIDNSETSSVAKRIEQAQDFASTNSDKAQLRVIENNFAYIVDLINQHDRDVARALRMLDEKINIVVQNMQRKYHPINPEDLTQANLSGGGIAFMVADHIDNRDSVEINLQLLPSGNNILALAKVVSCENIEGASEETPYLLRLAFTHMDEQDRNLLIRHTLKRQAQMLRSGEPSNAMSLHEI